MTLRELKVGLSLRKLYIPTDWRIVCKKSNSETDELIQRRYSLHPWRHPTASQRGERSTGQVRSTKSTVALGEAPRHPAPKLRRTKTFANLRFRHVPMTSLRGKTVENLARLGGHSYLILPSDIAPAPLQLPACLVATVMYLRKSSQYQPHCLLITLIRHGLAN